MFWFSFSQTLLTNSVNCSYFFYFFFVVSCRLVVVLLFVEADGMRMGHGWGELDADG